MLREEHRQRVYENRLLRKIFGLGGWKWQEAGEDCMNFTTCMLQQILLG
jgi:hypothetical protein